MQFPDLPVVSFERFPRRGFRGPQAAGASVRRRHIQPSGYFKCPVKFGARRNVLVLHTADLDRPFLTHNGELPEMLDPELDKALKEQSAQRSISEQVKWILKRLLAGARPDISAVARELGLSDRTLQRRIDDDGTTFRKLLLEARQELPHLARQELPREYLNRQDIEVAEVAYLLDYEDSNSFYRAFRTWEGTTPSQLRAELKRPV
jgi:AraC-like DNA-binding protein